MAQLSIPQSLIGALIDIADLGTLDYFPPTERCAHWSLYDAQHQELLCPCAPAANATTEKLFEAAAKILYENFPDISTLPRKSFPIPPGRNSLPLCVVATMSSAMRSRQPKLPQTLRLMLRLNLTPQNLQ